MAYWEDIVNILSNGTNDRANFDIPGIGNIYAQLPPPEIKRAAAVQSNVNIQKSSLRINRIKESSSLQYSLSFKFDSLEKTIVKIYWGAKEIPVFDSLGNVSYRFIDKDAKPVEPWTFGPFENKINQDFKLSENYVIDTNLLKKIGMGWVSELNLLQTPVIFTEPNSSSSLEENIKKSNTDSGLLNSKHIVEESGSPLKVVVQKENAAKTRKDFQDPFHLVIKLEAVTAPGKQIDLINDGMFIHDRIKYL